MDDPGAGRSDGPIPGYWDDDDGNDNATALQNDSHESNEPDVQIIENSEKELEGIMKPVFEKFSAQEILKMVSEMKKEKDASHSQSVNQLDIARAAKRLGRAMQPVLENFRAQDIQKTIRKIKAEKKANSKQLQVEQPNPEVIQRITLAGKKIWNEDNINYRCNTCEGFKSWSLCSICNQWADEKGFKCERMTCRKRFHVKCAKEKSVNEGRKLVRRHCEECRDNNTSSFASKHPSANRNQASSSSSNGGPPTTSAALSNGSSVPRSGASSDADD